MPFHYNAVSKPNGQVTTRIAQQGSVGTAEIVTAAAAESGLTAAQVTAAGSAIFRQIILTARESKNALRIFDLFSFRPTCGGEFPDLDFQPTPEAMNLAIRGSVAPAGQALFETGLDFVRDDTVGQKVPIIDRVYNATTNSTDHCTPGGGFKINGQDLGRPDLASSEFGVFLQPVAGGASVRCPSIIDWTENEITGVWASGVTGAQKLIIVTQYSFGSPRTTTYGTNLLP